ncbi:uncharacterized protein METZ01_LOCUS437220, partial [marine metagenome]
MGKRRSSRELTIKFLYQYEFNEGNFKNQIKSFLEQNSSEGEVGDFMKELVGSILEQIEEIDEIVQKYSDNWV